MLILEKSKTKDRKPLVSNPGRRRAAEKFEALGVSRHMTVRIPRGLTESIEEFLKTDQALKMGFHSKADVVTVAVRGLLTQYGFYVLPDATTKKIIKKT